MTIYLLEDRGYAYIFHWMVFMIAGLRHIPVNEDGSRVQIYFNVSKGQSYHNESLEAIRDAYEIVEPKSDSVVKNHHGEPLLTPDSVNAEAYLFLRNLFNSRISPPLILELETGKVTRLYISRKDSITSNPAGKGKQVRQILNENDFQGELKQLGFIIICLSEFSFVEKVRLFQGASIIISPHGSALTFSIFADQNCHIAEILPANIIHHNHYKIICENLKIPYHRFTNVSVVGDTPNIASSWNMNVDIPQFIKFVKSLVS